MIHYYYKLNWEEREDENRADLEFSCGNKGGIVAQNILLEEAPSHVVGHFSINVLGDKSVGRRGMCHFISGRDNLVTVLAP